MIIADLAKMMLNSDHAEGAEFSLSKRVLPTNQNCILKMESAGKETELPLIKPFVNEPTFT